ncbi:phosphoribosylpyrophosphate synthetase [Mesonia sp. K7]|uniref:phosphoribosylpyrophosphate synthetase n=1 Tax=Mesonia sp. K7 TaxID=2218606 RepID=UPI000DA7593C|nr:phosphoribosylpyrophosphate synthetase [Mesonia sp. K7]PZD77943.1 phosphoribosylpyrophosphate synthetase [Mesonia sp. K7]
MKSYDNLVEALQGLKKQGYTEDFNLKENCLECSKGKYKIFHNEFEIDKTFRFEDDTSSPEGSSILYAISSDKFNIKGTMVNSYGIYSDDIADEMLDKLNFSD